jgi:MFS family permease
LTRNPLLSEKNFRLYFAARIVSQLGDQLYVFAVSWFVLDLTRSALSMAGLLAVNSLAVVAAAPLGGLLADRASRRSILVATDVVQGIVLLGLLALRAAGHLGLAALYGGTVLLGLCSALFSPAASAIVPSLVTRHLVPAAVGAGQAAANVCTIVGMLLGGALYGLIGISGVLILNALSNLAAALLESRLRVAAPTAVPAACMEEDCRDARPGGTRFLRDLRGGLRHLGDDRCLAVMLLVNTVFTLAVMPIAMVYMPYLFNIVLGARPFAGALSQAATWAGIIAGSLLAARALRSRPPRPLIAGGLLALACHTIAVAALVGLGSRLGPAVLGAACTVGNLVAGAAGAFFIVPLYAFFHARAVESFRGRFWGLESATRTAAMCAGYFLAGLFVRCISLAAVLAGTGGVLLALCIPVLRLRMGPLSRE